LTLGRLPDPPKSSFVCHLKYKAGPPIGNPAFALILSGANPQLSTLLMDSISRETGNWQHKWWRGDGDVGDRQV